MASEADRDAEARRRATDPARSFIVQAPAGSGKTSLLTLRYLRLLATVEQPEQIVAITFTRKAASEMRHRIVAALALAARPVAADAAPHERERHALAVAALARSRARGWDLERNPSRLHVQTIDGLNHWLAQRLPLAARIGLASTVVDDARPLYREAARRLVASLDAGDERAPPLERLARALDHDPRRLAGLVADMLGSREVWLPKLFGREGSGQLRPDIDDLLRSALEGSLARVRAAIAGNIDPALFAVLREAAAAGGAASPLAPLAKLQALPDASANALPAWQSLADLLLVKGGTLRKSLTRNQGFLAASEGPPWRDLKRRMEAILETLAKAPGLARSLGEIRRLPPAALTDSQWERIESLVAVLPLAVAELRLHFAERGSLDHAAVAAAARDALREGSAPTELALALDYRIQHLLVDEYQDTSPAQERLLSLLLAGWQAGDGRTLFCVGDPMQSIYAFREADVTLFLQAAREGVGAVPLEALQLGRNFRSSGAIVDWVNASFAALLPAADDFERGAVRYTPAAAAREPAEADGVRVHALVEADAAAQGAEVARIARDALEGAPSAARPSIAILVRGRGSLPPLLGALREAGVDYRGIELEALADRTAIRDLVALARAMLHAGDRTAWLAVLRAPWCGLTLADLFALAGGDAEATIPGLALEHAARARLSSDGAARLARLTAALLPAIADRGRRSLGSWLKSAWLALAGPATVADPSDLVNAELLFAALDRLEGETGAWPEASAIDSAVEGIKASPVGRDDAPVQVMTIHKAKGLEFDVVIVPDLQRATPSDDRRLLYWTSIATGPGRREVILGSRSDADGDEADALETWMRALEAERAELELGRVAYVAATRARSKLHLVGNLNLRRSEAGAELARPRAGSLLEFFWPVLAAEFEASFERRQAAGIVDAPGTSARPRRAAPPLERLPLAFAAREPEAPACSPPLRISGEPEDPVRPEFDWAGTIAQAVGLVVHLELDRLARRAEPASSLMPRPRVWARLLEEAGVDAAHLPEALARTESALAAFARSRLAARLLDPAAREAASELSLTSATGASAQSLRIDRSFVDESGTRWVVDWKTGAHQGGDREAFLDRELERYRGQLERYARAMSLMEPGRKLRVGLYFPLLDAWREL